MRSLIMAVVAGLVATCLAPAVLAQDGTGGDPHPVPKPVVADEKPPAKADDARPEAGEPAKDGDATQAGEPAKSGEPGAGRSKEDAAPRAVKRGDPVRRDLSAYRLRVGDTFDVIVYLHEELTRLGITVPGNGEIAFPPIGKINLRDKTVFEVGAEIRLRLREEDFLTDPKVDCVITSYAPRMVYLVGAVHGTVSLPPHKNVRLLELLAMSGSLGNPLADFSRVTVKRYGPDGSSYNIDISVSDILERNVEEKNVVIFEGDYIIIRQLEEATPLSSDFVYILGKVRTPGRHPVVKGRTGFTLTKLIALAGDFDEFANRSKVTVIRKTDTGRQRFVVDFDEIIEGKRPDVDLSADDLVYVPESFF